MGKQEHYTKAFNIGSVDCDCTNHLKLSAAMRLMQLTSGEQCAKDGYAIELLIEQGMAFVLTKTCIKVHRMPECNRDILVRTAPIKTRGAKFVREFIIDSPEGERLVSANTLWVLVDNVTHKILRPSKFPYDLKTKEPLLSDIIDDIAIPANSFDTEVCITKPIRYSGLDINQHVNNSVYGDIICDMLPFDELTRRGIDIAAIQFLGEAKLDDALKLGIADLGAEGYLVKGEHGRGACFSSLVKLNS